MLHKGSWELQLVVDGKALVAVLTDCTSATRTVAVGRKLDKTQVSVELPEGIGIYTSCARSGTDGGDQHRNFTRLDSATHLVDGRFQRALDEGLQKSPSPRRNRIILDEVALQTHRTNPRTGKGSGIATVRQDQFGGTATDVQQKMGAVAEGHAGEHAQINQTSFLRTADKIHLDSKTIFDPLQIVATVGRLADSTGGGGHELLDLMARGQVSEPPQSVVATLHRSFGEFPCIWIAFTEACRGLLGLDDPECPQRGVDRSHQQMGGVRADINGSDPTQVIALNPLDVGVRG